MTEPTDAPVLDAPGTDQAPQVGDVPQEPQGQAPKVYDEQYVQKLRQEAADYRTKFNNFKKERLEVEQSKVTELEQAGQKIRALATQAEIAMLAAQSGVKNVKALTKMVKDDVQYDDNGAPTNLEALVKAALEEVPGLAASDTKPPTPQPGMGITPAKTKAGVPQVDPRKVNLFTPGIWNTEE
jgi:hypothetical protein